MATTSRRSHTCAGSESRRACQTCDAAHGGSGIGGGRTCSARRSAHRRASQNALPVFLDPDEKHTFKTVKVIHNALLADRFAPGDRPKRSDLVNGWPAEVREHVLRSWGAYGYRT